MNLDKVSRSWWWLIATLVLPAVVAGSGCLYLAYTLADQHAEIVRLRAALTACGAR